MSDNKNVCSSSVLHGVHGSTVTLENHGGDTVTVNACKDKPFAFSSPKAGFSIPPGGSVDATLQNAPGTYYYCTSGCHDKKEDTNPKTVIIS
jgi:hypothetical protein